MRFRQIEAFRALMMTGTVTDAAELLCVSQPAVSRLIADLERESNLSLFVRDKRRLRPTPEAKAFYREVERTFAGMDMLKRKAEDIRKFNSGGLRIISISALATCFLPRVIHKFSKKYPNITISLQTHSSGTVANWIAAQQFDVGLSFGVVENSGVDQEVFASTNAVCVLPQGHVLADKPYIRPIDLEGQEFVSLGPDDLTRRAIDRFFDSQGIERKTNLEAHLAGVVCGLVLDGCGVSIVNPFTACDFLSRGLVVKRFDVPIPTPFLIISPALHPWSSLTKSFVGAMEQHRDRSLAKFRQLGLVD